MYAALRVGDDYSYAPRQTLHPRHVARPDLLLLRMLRDMLLLRLLRLLRAMLFLRLLGDLLLLRLLQDMLLLRLLRGYVG